jgi:hypothetical protein
MAARMAMSQPGDRNRSQLFPVPGSWAVGWAGEPGCVVAVSVGVRVGLGEGVVVAVPVGVGARVGVVEAVAVAVAVAG